MIAFPGISDQNPPLPLNWWHKSKFDNVGTNSNFTAHRRFLVFRESVIIHVLWWTLPIVRRFGCWVLSVWTWLVISLLTEMFYILIVILITRVQISSWMLWMLRLANHYTRDLKLWYASHCSVVHTSLVGKKWKDYKKLPHPPPHTHTPHAVRISSCLTEKSDSCFP
jgi:hypothetical protein